MPSSPDPAGIRINFISDWHAWVASELSDAGYAVPPNTSGQELCILYFNACKRLIPPKPRFLRRAREFSCPSKRERALGTLLCRMEAGTDLTPYQSRAIHRLAARDALLYDWDVQHFHLGDCLDSSGRVKGTSELLFARVTDEAVYLLDVMDHDSFSARHLIDVLHRNWPGAIDNYQLHGILGPEDPPTDDETHELRRAGINTFSRDPKGSAYAPIGGGVTLSGVPVDAVRAVIHWNKQIRHFEVEIRGRLLELLTNIRNRGLTPADPPAFQLFINRDGLHAHETGSGVAFLLAPLSPDRGPLELSPQEQPRAGEC